MENKSLIETEFAAESGYGNSVFSDQARMDNFNHKCFQGHKKVLKLNGNAMGLRSSLKSSDDVQDGDKSTTLKPQLAGIAINGANVQLNFYNELISQMTEMGNDKIVEFLEHLKEQKELKETKV